LDQDNTLLVSELLYSSCEKWGKTLMVVTHDKEVAERAMHCYTLERGVFVEQLNDEHEEGED
jgi:lipoprotein-releasing system ATP-binding protein